MGLFRKKILKVRKRKSKVLLRQRRNEKLATIFHPTSTTKDYKTMVLDNGLSVLLISSNSSQHNAASVSVRCGSFADPANMQGLAHLLEHILFLGSENFPGVNQIREFVQLHNGEVYGKTELDHSIFSIQVDPVYFTDALRMFADMFVNPLLDFERFKSELRTIDSEFELRKYKDSTRFEQLLSHTSSESHPFHRFTWGNKHSFSKCDLESLHSGLKKLFTENYIASNMNLVLVGKDSLDDLEELVVSCFSNLKEGSKEGQIEKGPATFANYLQDPELRNGIWDSSRVYILESLEGCQSIQISWVLPPTHHEVRPERYIANLLCQENEGSLASFLKHKGWISSFDVAVGNDLQFGSADHSCPYNSTSMCQLFVIQADITNSGWEKKYDLVSYVFQYLNFLRSEKPSPSLINEYTTSLKMKYEALDFDSEGSVRLYAEVLAGNMLKGPVSHALCLDYLYTFGSEQEMQDIFEYFSSKNMRIDFFSKPFTDGAFEIEPMFNAKYKLETIPASYIDKWNDNTEFEAEFSLPTCNSLMPSQFFHTIGSFSSLDSLSSPGTSSYFELCVDDFSTKLFYREAGLLSSAYFNIYLNVGDDAKAKLTTKTCIEMVKQDLRGIIFKGEEALMHATLSFGDYNSLELRFYGFNEKLKDFITEFWNRITSFIPDEKCFEIAMEKMHVESTSTDLLQQAVQLVSKAVVDEDNLADEFGITVEDVMRFDFGFPEIRVVGLCSGRFSSDESTEIINIFGANGDFEIPMEIASKRVLRPGQPLKITSKPEIDCQSNSLAMVYFQVNEEPDYKTAYLQMFKVVIEEYLYSQLRLKERLGYDLGCDIHLKSDISGFIVYVVSADHQPSFLLQRIYGFVSTIGQYLESVDEEKFESYKRKANDFEDGGMSHNLINDYRCISGRGWKVEKVLRKMKKRDLILFYEMFFTRTSCCSIDVCITSSLQNED